MDLAYYYTILDLVTMHGAAGRRMLPSYHRNAQQILCKGQEKKWMGRKTRKEEKEKKKCRGQ